MSVVPANGGGLLNRQWWRVCLVHGDQTKYYRQLYGGHKRAAIRTQLHNDAKKITSAVDAASAGGGGGGQCAACGASASDIAPG